MLLICPKVEAKEYDVEEILTAAKSDGSPFWSTSFEAEAGDVIEIKGQSGDLYTYYRMYVYDDQKEEVEYYDKNQDTLPNTYVIKSYEELTGKQIPEGSAVLIQVDLSTNCSAGAIHIYYVLSQATEKKIVYHDTFDAVNNNPTSYYVGSPDILLQDLSREGYRFLGWYTSPDFAEDSRITMITQEEPEVLNLYAKWEKIEESEIQEEGFSNPETRSMMTIGVTMSLILVLGTVAFLIYRKKAKEKI
mgnify:FL=1